MKMNSLSMCRKKPGFAYCEQCKVTVEDLRLTLGSAPLSETVLRTRT